MATDTNRDPDGFIACWSDAKDGPDMMAVWLPDGETAETLGLSTWVPMQEPIEDEFDDFDDVEGEAHEDCP